MDADAVLPYPSFVLLSPDRFSIPETCTLQKARKKSSRYAARQTKKLVSKVFLGCPVGQGSLEVEKMKSKNALLMEELEFDSWIENATTNERGDAE